MIKGKDCQYWSSHKVPKENTGWPFFSSDDDDEIFCTFHNGFHARLLSYSEHSSNLSCLFRAESVKQFFSSSLLLFYSSLHSSYIISQEPRKKIVSLWHTGRICKGHGPRLIFPQPNINSQTSMISHSLFPVHETCPNLLKARASFLRVLAS